jgi:hypothetical protein
MKANLKGSRIDGRIDQDRHRARLWLVLRMMISTTLAYALAAAPASARLSRNFSKTWSDKSVTLASQGVKSRASSSQTSGEDLRTRQAYE